MRQARKEAKISTVPPQLPRFKIQW